MKQTAHIIYWDSSAIISALLPDPHTDEALAWAGRPGKHIISTLAWAEALAVISRAQRTRLISAADADVAREEIAGGRWNRLQESPDWIILRELAARWTLAGPDLWHVALAKTLQREQPDLRLLSFDRRLAEAAAGEGLALQFPR